jgi:hypothetical protein
MKCVICQIKNPRGPGWMEATVRNTTGKRELISFHRICGGLMHATLCDAHQTPRR